MQGSYRHQQAQYLKSLDWPNRWRVLPWSAPTFNTPEWRRTVVPLKEDQCQQSPQLLDASCDNSDETRALGSRTSFNSALSLKILLICSLSWTSGWQFPSLLAQCCIRASLGADRWGRRYDCTWGSSQIFSLADCSFLSFCKELGSSLREHS